jgi:hypothetical protein
MEGFLNLALWLFFQYLSKRSYPSGPDLELIRQPAAAHVSPLSWTGSSLTHKVESLIVLGNKGISIITDPAGSPARASVFCLSKPLALRVGRC